MNETNEGNWLFRLVMTVGTMGMLIVLIGCMFAPAFAPWIRGKLAASYAEYSDWERRVNEDMKSIVVFLWLLALAAWAFVFWCNR